jgi:hypothetical protein
MNFGEKDLQIAHFWISALPRSIKAVQEEVRSSTILEKVHTHVEIHSFIVLYAPIMLHAPAVFSLLLFALNAFVASESTSKVSGSIMTP